MKIHPIHPFPARMASSIVWNRLQKAKMPLRILDPMAGSGTTLVNARICGHLAFGCDTDPLALLIARVWCSDFNTLDVRRKANVVIKKAQKLSKQIRKAEAYPQKADVETREFIDFWFDDVTRIQLTALATIVSRIRNQTEKAIFWCAFSRLIITKKAGVSLAMDVSHSRPHKIYSKSPIKPFDKFLYAVEYILKHGPFADNTIEIPPVNISTGDARSLPIEANSIDMVITSPPYLNAIDYLRGHRLSLVWMGYTIKQIKLLRSSNIGSEIASVSDKTKLIEAAMAKMGKIDRLSKNKQSMLSRYVNDLRLVIQETYRVLTPKGRAVFVIGDSVISGVLVENSKALVYLAKDEGLRLLSKKMRTIPENRRYLPPPTIKKSGGQMQNRMRSEVIITFSVS